MKCRTSRRKVDMFTNATILQVVGNEVGSAVYAYGYHKGCQYAVTQGPALPMPCLNGYILLPADNPLAQYACRTPGVVGEQPFELFNRLPVCEEITFAGILTKGLLGFTTLNELRNAYSAENIAKYGSNIDRQRRLSEAREYCNSIDVLEKRCKCLIESVNKRTREWSRR